jgi:acetyl-CoA carboxylase biotin carboxyl carrier protein
MDFEKLKEFIDLAKSSGVSELKFENGKEKYEVALPISGSTFIPQVSTQVINNEGNNRVEVDESLVSITCPFVGTFYRSPSPDAKAYANVGDRVSSGSVLCIVEAMKIMNEIESEVSGEIVEICVEDETYVEFGQVLFKVRT